MNDHSPDFRVTMPREFFLLIDYLHKQGPKVDGAFSLSSLEFKRAKDVKFNCIRDWLDTWSSNEFRKLNSFKEIPYFIIIILLIS